MKPRHIAYTIWTVIALLGVVCLIVPEKGFSFGKYTLRWPTLTEALDLKEDSIANFDLDVLNDSLLAESDTIGLIPSDSVIQQDTLVAKDSIPQKPRPIIPEEHVPTTDSRAYLATFYAALDSAASMPVRVVHYGDSQIEEDRITNILRENWQKQYGGGGVGLIPLHQNIPTRSIRQTLSINGVIQTIQKGPKRYIIYGPKSMRLTDSDDYGVMGQVALLDSTLVPGSDSIVLHIEPLEKKRKPHNYFNRARVLADSSITFSLSPLASLPDTLRSLTAPDSLLPIADSTTHCDIILQGTGKVFGISLETNKGVIVDNIPMRGCSGNIFTKIDSIQLSNFYRESNTRLIILQFGGNMIPQTENPTTIRGYVRSTMRQQVRYIRTCAPKASILLIGPSDMSTNIDGTMTTYPLIPYMDQQFKKMAQEEGIAYWSMYEAMGGYNSMVTWHDKGLAGSDYVHFTRSGANNIGKKLYKWLMSYQSDSLNTKL
jgi:lysophospholipase L1-like esterase